MIINFICRQNSYRSRLAEAYFNSLKIPDVKAISSGYEAEKNEDGPISWVAARILKRQQLLPFMSDKWQQLSQELINGSDLLVFISDEVYQYSSKNFDLKNKKYEIWNIKDFEDFGITLDDNSLEDELKKIKISDQTYEEIKNKIDEFINRSL